ncbi:MAG TPA: integrin alpha, partial [Planctomycetota bacterium]|nr:integrin alpha [Planctomycetota bacterium]
MVRFLPATLLRSRLALTTAGGLLLAGTPSAQLAIYAVDGPGPDQAFGNSIAKLPDVNADGVPDLLVGAFTKNDSRGAACVLSGKTGVTLQSWNGTEEFEYLGQCVAAIGDIDKDGVNDVAIGAPYFDVGPASVAGRVLVCSAKTGTLLRTHLGPPSSANFGAAIAGLGDLDNDGTNDYAIGSPFLNVDGAYDQGQVTLFSGKTGAALLALNGPATQHGKFGTHIVNAGDVNGDGKADLAITSPEWVSAGGLHTGRVEVRSGANLNVTLFAAEGQLDGEKLGFALAAAGDVNHDGLADIIAATWFDNDDAGVARVFLGPSGAASWVFHGDAAFDHFGCSVDGAGDVDKDGWADLVVGAYRAAFQVMNQPGYARVFSGRTGQALVTLTGTQATDEFGYAVCGAGDLNGDGWADVAVGSVSWDGINGTASGHVGPAVAV